MPGCVTPGNRIVRIQRHARNHARKLRAAALHDAVAVGANKARSEPRTEARCARTPCRNLPAIQHQRPSRPRSSERQFVDIAGVEVVAHIVIAGAAIAAADRPAAATECLPRRTTGIRRSKPYRCSGSRCSSPAACKPCAEPLLGGRLQAVVVAVRAGGELRHGREPRVGRLRRKGTARSIPRTPSDSRSPASCRAGSRRACPHTARAD